MTAKLENKNEDNEQHPALQTHQINDLRLPIAGLHNDLQVWPIALNATIEVNRIMSKTVRKFISWSMDSFALLGH